MVRDGMQDLSVSGVKYSGGPGLQITRTKTPGGLPPMRAGLVDPLALPKDALPSIIEQQRKQVQQDRRRRQGSALWEPRHRREKAATIRARTAEASRTPVRRRPRRKVPALDRRAPAAATPLVLPEVPSPRPAALAAPQVAPPRPPADVDAELGSYREDPAFVDVPRLEIGFGDDDDRSVCTFCTRDSITDASVAPTLSRKNMGTRVWAGSFVLIQYMLHLGARRPPPGNTFLFDPAGASPRLEYDREPPLEGERVLELGAGTAICGMVAHILAKAKKVVVTDRDPVVCALARHNLAMNNDDDDGGGTGGAENPGRHVHVLDWYSKIDAQNILKAHFPSSTAKAGFDTIIASDVLYDPKDLPFFFACVTSLLRKDDVGRRPRRGSSRAGDRSPRRSPRVSSPTSVADLKQTRPPRLILVYEDRLKGFEALVLKHAREAGLAVNSVDFLADFFDPDLEIVDGEVGTPSFFSASSVAPGNGSWTSLRLFVCRPRK